MLSLGVVLGLFTIAPACTETETSLGSTAQAETGCVNGADSYFDENGDEIECVYTDDPGWQPTDPCFLFPELCNPPGDDDPCVINPSSCVDPGGGGGELPTCTQTFPDGPPADLAQQVADRVAPCFQQDWSTVPFREETNADYNTANDSYFVQFVNWATGQLGCVIGSESLEWIYLGDTAGAQALQSVISRLNEQAKTQHLTPHQKMCSAMCAASKLIQYSSDSASGVLNTLPSNAVASGVGVCREFSQIGVRLLNGMGITASLAMNYNHSHAYVSVTSPEGGSFYMEPQHGNAADCVFYNRH